ncbi:PREDICTED: cadherin-like and PC-esterase domain-containing protein 1 [Priapulus caudatus]|uniref:Cadherin-like and PC-esterase domain-containing protein 1 n=1 Tax=Priapulus caudatus TaxID=37621 RepID=A0ABM1EG33_PRICU|nr:PREDICTED: cadherin-like and PC-esterase domain-containing protein 1 [Priapulus caudatus]
MCLAGRKVLVFGDSTMGGVARYIQERLIRTRTKFTTDPEVIVQGYIDHHWTLDDAGSPHELEKAQNAFDTLLRRAGKLENGDKTVLLFGASYWLTPQHIPWLLENLKKNRLDKIAIQIKSINVALHLPAKELNKVLEPRAILERAQETAEMAEQHGVAVTDAFNMTAARYREFRAGGFCACHFDIVKKKKKDVVSDSDPRQIGDTGINTVFTDMIISSLCRRLLM